MLAEAGESVSRRPEEEPNGGTGLKAPEEDVCGENGVSEGLVFGISGVGEEMGHCGCCKEVVMGPQWATEASMRRLFVVAEAVVRLGEQFECDGRG